jgi:hypothetical protein
VDDAETDWLSISLKKKIPSRLSPEGEVSLFALGEEAYTVPVVKSAT